jgi:hypothetical protein
MMRVPETSAVEIGSLLTDPAGNPYVVVRKRGDDYWTAELGDVENFMAGGEMYEERYAPEGWNAGDYPQRLTGTAPAEVSAAIHAALESGAAVDAVMAGVPSADVPTLYNLLAGARYWRGQALSDPGSAAQHASRMAREVGKVTSLVGSLSAAATLLGTDEESLRREIGA